jgi:hypothetical protein
MRSCDRAGEVDEYRLPVCVHRIRERKRLAFIAGDRHEIDRQPQVKEHGHVAGFVSGANLWR